MGRFFRQAFYYTIKAQPMGYKNRKSFEDRKTENQQLIARYPGRVCLVVEAGASIVLNKFKFLTPEDLTVGQMMHVVRKHIDGLPPSAALFFFTKHNSIPPMNMTIGTLAKSFGDKDGNVYLDLRTENTFGA